MSRPSHTRRAGTYSRELRRQLTISEKRLWPEIRRGATGARFRRQVPIGEYVADFAALSPRLVVELDGPDHYWKDELARSRYLERLGFAIVSYDDKDVAQQLENVVSHISATVSALRAGTPLPEW